MSPGFKVAENATPSTTTETNGEEELVIASASSSSSLVTPSLVVSDTILGSGSHGTVVFQGSFQGRSVAVKRLLKDFVALAVRELSVIRENDAHPNVVRCYDYWEEEEHSKFSYIVLEQCPASLVDIIEARDKDQWRDAFDSKKALRQIAGGLGHLHALNVVHRDMRPQNILVSDKGDMLISDYGLYEKSHGGQLGEAWGWRAPEVVRGEGTLLDEMTASADVFALGCVFYYVVSNGGYIWRGHALTLDQHFEERKEPMVEAP